MAFDPNVVQSKASIAHLRANIQPYAVIWIDGYWGSGPDGGEGNFFFDASDTTSGAVVMASISGTTLTVASVVSGALAIGQSIGGNGISSGVWIAGGSGSSWTLSANLGTISGRQITADDGGGTFVVDTAGNRYKRETPYPATVKFFGALGDNSTDDYYAVAAALAAVPAGSILYVPEGTYLTSAVLSPPSNLTLSMAPGATIKASATGYDLFDITGSVAAGVDLASNAAAGQTDVVLTDGSSFAADDTVMIVGSTSTGAEKNVEFNTVASVVSNTLTMERDLSDTYLTSEGAYVQKITFKENIHFEGGTLQGGSPSSLSRYVADIDYARRVSFENVHVLDTLGIKSDYSEDIAIRNSHLRNCSDAARCDYTTAFSVIDCFIEKSASGVVVYYNSDKAIVRGCRISNVSGVPLQANYYSEDSIFEGNDVAHSAGGYGILIDNGSSRSRVVGNTVRYGAGSGIHMGESYHTCANNIVTNQATGGIIFEGSDYGRCIGNLVENIGTTTSHHGIQFNGSTVGCNQNLCEANTVRAVTGECIHWDGETGGGTSNICAGNTVNIDYRGITFGNLDYSTCRANSYEGTASPSVYFLGDSQSLTTMTGDGRTMTDNMDLSGAATTQYLQNPQCDILFFRITLIVTEATSADDGVRVYVTTVAGGGGGAIVDFPTGASSPLKSLALRTTTEYFPIGTPSYAVKQGGVVAADDLLYASNAGGKTGTGEITLQMDYIDLGSS